MRTNVPLLVSLLASLLLVVAGGVGIVTASCDGASGYCYGSNTPPCNAEDCVETEGLCFGSGFNLKRLYIKYVYTGNWEGCFPGDGEDYCTVNEEDACKEYTFDVDECDLVELYGVCTSRWIRGCRTARSLM